MRQKARERFVNLAENRVNKALKDIDLIGNLSNKSNYEYTDEEARKIVKALRSAVDEVKAKFEASPAEARARFTLDQPL